MNAESALFWVSAVGYSAAALLVTAALVFRRTGLSTAGFGVTAAAFAAQTGSIVARWMASGRLPYVDDYENVLAGTWFIVALYLLMSVRRPQLRSTGVVALPFVVLTLGYALTIDRGIGPVTPAYKSLWLGIHVLFAWATYSAYTACAALAVIELLKSRESRSGRSRRSAVRRTSRRCRSSPSAWFRSASW